MGLFFVGLVIGLVLGIVLTLFYAKSAIAAARAEAQKVLGSVNSGVQNIAKKIS